MRNHRRSTILLVAACIAAPAVGGAFAINAQVALPSNTLRQAFEARIRGRLDAVTRADSLAYRAFIDPDLIFLMDDGSRSNARQQLRYIAGRPVGRSRYTIDSLTVSSDGSMAVADYRVTEYVRYGSRELPGPERGIDIYLLKGKEWLLRAHGEAPLLTLPPAVPVDSATLADYAGDYEWWPGNVDRIRVRHGALIEQGPDDPTPLQLRAASPEAFFIEGDPSLLTFVRNRAGRVTGYLIHFATGQVVTARRVP